MPAVERLAPPASLLRETEHPEWKGETNGDLLEHAINLDAALRGCNADKSAIRLWLEAVSRNATEETHMEDGR